MPAVPVRVPPSITRLRSGTLVSLTGLGRRRLVACSDLAASAVATPSIAVGAPSIVPVAAAPVAVGPLVALVPISAFAGVASIAGLGRDPRTRPGRALAIAVGVPIAIIVAVIVLTRLRTAFIDRL